MIVQLQNDRTGFGRSGSPGYSATTWPFSLTRIKLASSENRWSQRIDVSGFVELEEELGFAKFEIFSMWDGDS